MVGGCVDDRGAETEGQRRPQPAAGGGELGVATIPIEQSPDSTTQMDLGTDETVWDTPAGRDDAARSASPDSVRAYLRQIGKVALLNAQQEVELAQRIEAGLFASQRLAAMTDSDKTSDPTLYRDLRMIVRR